MPGNQDAANPIQHVVVLMLENRSFDHMLGCCQQVYPALAGIDPVAPARTNSDGSTSYLQTPGAARILAHNPLHEYRDVVVQLGGSNAGFVQNYAQAYPNSTKAARAEIMKYHDLGTLPALHALAQHFTICDHWFAPVPGPTWTNRLFALSGTALGRVKMPNGLLNLNLHWYDQPTLFDRLNERHILWKIYFGDIPLFLLFVHQWEPHNTARYCLMTEFHRDAAGPAAEFPAFCFIEPSYGPPGANDDHPPHDVLEGEVLIASVYNALRANEELWSAALLLVLFDEHGGLYHHVEPPATVPPDHHQEEFTFDRLGVRVPAILASPWVARGVLVEVFDHTSLLKFLADKWHLGPLGNRVANARMFASALLKQPRATPPSIPVPGIVLLVEAPPPSTFNDHQTALVALSHLLESMTVEDPNVIAARSRQVLSSPQSQIDVAMDRLERFLVQQRTKAK